MEWVWQHGEVDVAEKKEKKNMQPQKKGIVMDQSFWGFIQTAEDIWWKQRVLCYFELLRWSRSVTQKFSAALILFISITFKILLFKFCYERGKSFFSLASR